MNQISPRAARTFGAKRDYVLATHNYTRGGGGKPAAYMYDRPDGVPGRLEAAREAAAACCIAHCTSASVVRRAAVESGVPATATR